MIQLRTAWGTKERGMNPYVSDIPTRDQLLMQAFKAEIYAKIADKKDIDGTIERIYRSGLIEGRKQGGMA